MVKHQDLTQQETHFKFGKNWEAFSSYITEERIQEAQKSLTKFFGNDGLKGKTFLDIGCGSGLFSLAALRLGVKKVLAIDIDPDSVQTTQTVLRTFAPKSSFECQHLSVFDLNSKIQGTFDIVYSWGVLHHTGNMVLALEKAIEMMAPDGIMAVALYKKTPLCKFWKKEKRIYTNAPFFVQKLFRGIWYTTWFLVTSLIFRNNPVAYVRNYQSSRGMSFSHDVHDWLGGYPYESITPQEMYAFLNNHSLQLKEEFLIPQVRLGLLGTGCDEYVFSKNKNPLPKKRALKSK